MVGSIASPLLASDADDVVEGQPREAVEGAVENRAASERSGSTGSLSALSFQKSIDGVIQPSESRDWIG